MKDVARYWAAAFFDSRDQETLNDMAAQARRQLIHQNQLTRDEFTRIRMKFPNLTSCDR